MKRADIIIEIDEILKAAKVYGLQSEVVGSALSVMKQSKGTMSVLEALNFGFNEWVK